MKLLTIIFKDSGLLLTLFFLMTFSAVNAQNNEFTISITNPVDTALVCQDENIFFKADAVNSDGTSFDYSAVRFIWDMGYIGESKEGISFAYFYPEGGVYEVKLLAIGPNSDSIYASPVFIKVSPDPVFTGTFCNLSSICSGEELILSGEVQPIIWASDSLKITNSFLKEDYEWFGNGIIDDDLGVALATPELDKGHQSYTFQVKDNLGCFYDTTFLINGLVAKYDFEPKEGEAPLEVSFTVDSLDNGGEESLATFEWNFYEIHDTTNILISNVDIFSFEKPGEYSTKLIVSYNQCSFVHIAEEYVHVDSSLLEVPNVFTPNGDNVNDFFQVKSLSLLSFEGKIFNRWGKIVYEWTEWKDIESGWNGKVLGQGKDAPEGVYFYVIRAVGWDDIKYRDGLYKGSLHLFR